MRPIYELSNPEKAKYLHGFLPNEMKPLISYIEYKAAHILKHKEETEQQWESRAITIADWLHLAAQAYQKIQGHRLQLAADSQFFANELFRAKMGLFSLHCIQEYIQD